MSLPSLRSLAALVGSLALVGTAVAQQPSQEELKARKSKKLAEKFITAAPWLTDYDQALETAKKDGKLIFAYFTRSYAP